ncbi:TlpA disulfide reductase family protein [Flavobacterium sp. HSC-61S13]|uniref:TlpA family protein disulfide reductase n=1 Tax=Flavobacterium sp. HSC-61S13 TaxID=2910963 RepID=UPI00209F6EE4|nr:TlpA disulfide reductase family protein [Flavobacterium sp. HSC-61S13]MCP1997126.1 peroxiredoxin [Flavobacterium sp. HSC-61S13]
MRKIVGLFVLLFSMQGIAQTTLPNIELKNMDGKKVLISDYAKKDNPVIISFWATWCGPCLKELNAINDVYSDWQKETGVELVAVSIDDAKTSKRVKPLVKGKNWEYEILMDDNQALKRAMNVANVPFTIVVYKGKIVYKHLSYAPGVEKEMYAKIKSLVK